MSIIAYVPKSFNYAQFSKPWENSAVIERSSLRMLSRSPRAGPECACPVLAQVASWRASFGDTGNDRMVHFEIYFSCFLITAMSKSCTIKGWGWLRPRTPVDLVGGSILGNPGADRGAGGRETGASGNDGGGGGGGEKWRRGSFKAPIPSPYTGPASVQCELACVKRGCGHTVSVRTTSA